MKNHFKNSSFIIFITIAIFYTIGNFIWWKINTPIIPQGICAVHFRDIFEDSVFFYNNAPLMSWIMKFAFHIFGKQYFDLQIMFVNFLFFVASLFFVYKLGEKLGRKETGNVAMFLFALTPVIYGMSRQYGHQDWHVMCAMTANIYCLIMAKDFKDRKWSVLYGISVGFGLLIKDEFLPYFFSPWLYVVLRSLIKEMEKDKIINIIITILTGSLLAGGHYFNMYRIGKILHDPIIETKSVFCFESLRITTLGLSEYLLSPPIFVLFAIGLIWFVLKFNNKNKPIILLWIMVPWLIIMFMPHHKLPEYETGFVPAMILIASIYFCNIKHKYVKKMVMGIILLIGLLQYVDFSYAKYSYGLGFKYKSHKINYFDIEVNDDFFSPNYMGYEKNMEIISLVSYLRNNFIGNSIYLYQFINTTETMVSYLKVNGVHRVYFCMPDMVKSDIIVDVEKYSVLNEEYVFEQEKLFLQFHKLKENLEEVREKINATIAEVKNNYVKIDEFYLNEENKKAEKHVSVLGKRDLFAGKDNIIKIPYELQKD